MNWVKRKGSTWAWVWTHMWSTSARLRSHFFTSITSNAFVVTSKRQQILLKLFFNFSPLLHQQTQNSIFTIVVQTYGGLCTCSCRNCRNSQVSGCNWVRWGAWTCWKRVINARRVQLSQCESPMCCDTRGCRNLEQWPTCWCLDPVQVRRSRTSAQVHMGTPSHDVKRKRRLAPGQDWGCS